MPYKIRDKKLMKKFGAHLRMVRIDAGLSQPQLANKAGIELSQISRIELGKTDPTMSTVSIIAKALGITLSELVNY
jgi:transcriptional regulator with XRE-family HTH domain